MRLHMSSNIALRTNRMIEATDFYTSVFGFENRSDNPELVDLDAAPLTFFIIPDDKISGLVLELVVSDLEEARHQLEAQGCRVLRWWGKGQDCYIQDPFGLIYNLWEE